MALLQGLESSGNRAIPRLLVFGDSRHVIFKMIIGYPTRSIKYRRLYDRIYQLPLSASIDQFYILRENNAQEDALENIGASLPQGLISINNEKAYPKPIP